jgi:hypothetical protein
MSGSHDSFFTRGRRGAGLRSRTQKTENRKNKKNGKNVPGMAQRKELPPKNIPGIKNPKLKRNARKANP